MTVVLGIPVGLGGQSNRLCVGGGEAGEGKAQRSSCRQTADTARFHVLLASTVMDASFNKIYVFGQF